MEGYTVHYLTLKELEEFKEVLLEKAQRCLEINDETRTHEFLIQVSLMDELIIRAKKPARV